MIAITGATGRLGLQVARRLIKIVSPQRMVVLARDVKRVDTVLQLASVRESSYDDPTQMAKALDGVSTLFMVSTRADHELRTLQHRNAIDAAVAAGVRRVVYTSFAGAVAENPFTWVAVNADTEPYLMASGLAYTILRNNFFYDNLLEVWDQAKQCGFFNYPGGQGHVSHVAIKDAAEAASRVMLSEDYSGQTFEISGPEPLTYPRIAEIMSNVLGRSIEFRPLSFDDFADQIASTGAEPYKVAGAANGFRAAGEDFFKVTDSDTAKLLGDPPMTLAKFLERHR